MNRSSRPRKTAKLSASVHKQINTYALAATAAGVASLALPQAVEAKVVYTLSTASFHLARATISI
jgi:hypothetical protein